MDVLTCDKREPSFWDLLKDAENSPMPAPVVPIYSMADWELQQKLVENVADAVEVELPRGVDDVQD